MLFFPDVDVVFKKSTESSLQRPHHFFPVFLRQSQLGNLRFTLTCAKASSHRNEDNVIKLERPPCLSPFPISKEKSNAAPSDLQLIRFLYCQPHRGGLQLWFEMSKSSHPPPAPSLPQPNPPLQQVPRLHKRGGISGGGCSCCFTWLIVTLILQVSAWRDWSDSAKWNPLPLTDWIGCCHCGWIDTHIKLVVLMLLYLKAEAEKK